MFFLIFLVQGRPDIAVQDNHIEFPDLPFLCHRIFKLYCNAVPPGERIDERRSSPDESHASSAYIPQGIVVLVAPHRTEIGIEDHALNLRISPYRPLGLLHGVHATDGGTV